MWKNYIKIAWRNLRRNSVFSLINIGGLSLGLTCCMLILLYIKDEASFDRFHENLDQLHRVKVTMTTLAGGVALIVALFTVSVQVLKAAVANPVKSLRSE